MKQNANNDVIKYSPIVRVKPTTSYKLQINVSKYTYAKKTSDIPTQSYPFPTNFIVPVTQF